MSYRIVVPVEGSGGFINGVSVDAWEVSRFADANVPAKDSAPPSGSPDAGPVTTATNGAPGQAVLDVPAGFTYNVRVQQGGHSYWTQTSEALGVKTFQGRTAAAATMTKADVTGTGLTYSDVGADASGAAATVQGNLNTEASTRASADTTLQTNINTEAASRVAGDALAAKKASNLSDLASASTARTNLGLGDAATHPASDFSGSPAGTAGKPLAATDLTTTNSRTPTAHASSHASAGTDPITIAESQVTGLVADLAAKAPLASPALTGSPTAPTQAAGDNSTKLSTTAYADSAVGVETSRATTAEAILAPKASPALTGSPTAPTQAAADNSTKIATTAYADGAVASAKGLPVGLTGATSATRFVGATTSSSPVSGTFAVGDFVVDQSGNFWICTSAGSPGTWTSGPTGPQGPAGPTGPSGTLSNSSGVIMDSGSYSISTAVDDASGTAASLPPTAGTSVLVKQSETLRPLPPVTGIVANGSTWVITFANAHLAPVGGLIYLQDFVPAGWNAGTFSAPLTITAVTSTTITVAKTTSPAAITTIGSAIAIPQQYSRIGTFVGYVPRGINETEGTNSFVAPPNKVYGIGPVYQNTMTYQNAGVSDTLTTTNGSANITKTGRVANGVCIGQYVLAAGVPSLTQITAIKYVSGTNTTTITMSANATASASVACIFVAPVTTGEGFVNSPSTIAVNGQTSFIINDNSGSLGNKPGGGQGWAIGYWDGPIFYGYNSAGQGAIANIQHVSFVSHLFLTSYATAALRYGYLFDDVKVGTASSLDVQVGVAIGQMATDGVTLSPLSNASTNVGIMNASSTVNVPSAVTVTNGGTINSGATHVEMTSAGNVSTSTSGAVIATPAQYTTPSGTTWRPGNGKTLMLVNANAIGGGSIVFTSNATTNLSLGAATRTVAPGGCLTLMYNQTHGRWVETAFNPGGN